MPAALASPIWSTPHRPSRITSVSTTAIGHDTNVLQKTAIDTTSTDMSHTMSRLLNRLNAKLAEPVARTTDDGCTPSHWSGVSTRTMTSNGPSSGNAERGIGTYVMR